MYGYFAPVAIPDRDPTPPSCPVVAATVPVEKFPLHDVSRIKAAAERAAKLYPGPVGEYLRAELHAYAEYGVAWSTGCRANRMAIAITNTPLPS